MNRVDGIEINIYWSDLTEEAKRDIEQKLSAVGIELSVLITNDADRLTWKSIYKDGD